MNSSRFEAEVDRNFDAFEAVLASLLATNPGQFALMRRGEIVSFFDSEALALAQGRAKFQDGLFSVQEVTDRPADLGFFSHAVNPRIA